MANYSPYVSFELPNSAQQSLLDYGIDPKDMELSGGALQNIQQALREIASTPEGLQALRTAAENSPDGKIHIVAAPDTGTYAIDNPEGYVLNVGDLDNTAIYRGTETDQWFNISAQRMIFHELQHFSGHATSGIGIDPREEARAIEETNRFMGKYYAEEPRHIDPDDTNHTRVEGGNEGWSLNRNFHRQGASLEIEIPEGPFDAITATDSDVIREVAQAGVNIDPSSLPSANVGNTNPALGNNGQDFGIT